MHFNREKISKPKLKISPRRRKNKSSKKANKKDIKPVVKSKKKNKLRITRSILDNFRSSDREKYKGLKKWTGLLNGHTAFILGNSPSIIKHNLKLLNPYFTIGVNRICYIYDPTILLWQDKEIWDSCKKNIKKQKSIKICSANSDPRNIFINFKLRLGEFKFTKDLNYLYGTGNTGALAIEVAVALGCSNIVLLGTDCKYGKKGRTDFYGKNKDHKTYTLKMCNAAMKWVKQKCPVPVYNCSENKLWPTRSLNEIIKEIRPEKFNREYYLNVFKK